MTAGQVVVVIVEVLVEPIAFPVEARDDAFTITLALSWLVWPSGFFTLKV